MTFYVETEFSPVPDIQFEDLLKSVAEKTLKMENCPYEAEVSLLLTGPEEIRRLNREYRGVDAETDVLSFPMTEYGAPADFNSLDPQGDSFHPETGELLLGDIILSVPRAVEQAGQYGHGVLREFAFLIAHSMLHLLGYDHMEPEEAAVMEKKQDLILRELGIERSPEPN